MAVEPPPAKQSTVLIVDDDPTIQMILRAGIQRKLREVEVVTASNGAEGLEELRRRHVDLLITDLNMPVMDGITFLSHVIEEFPQIPRVVISSLGEGPRRYAEKMGVVAVLTKPLDVIAVGEQVEQWLRDYRPHTFVQDLRLASFVQLVGFDRKTCTIGVRDRDSGRLGMLFFRDGVPVDAVAGELSGADAALLLLAWENVQFWVHNYMPVEEDKIGMSLDWLLLEAARLSDEQDGAAERNRAVPTPAELRDNRPDEVNAETPPRKIAPNRAPPSRTIAPKPAPPPPKPPRPRSTGSLIDDATAAFRARKYDVAKELWEQALEKMPDNPVIKYNLAVVRRCLEKME